MFLALEKSQNGPKFVASLSNVMARAGQKLKLECEVETDEPPTLIWSHNGKIMKEIKDFKVYNIKVLYFCFVSPENSFYIKRGSSRFPKIAEKLI